MAEWAKREDFEEILEKADIIFGGEGNTDYFQLYHPKLYSVRNSAEEHLIVREADGIKGMLGVFPAQMDVCGRKIQVDGFGTMGVMKDARGKGYMKDLMNTAVSASKSRADIAFLGGRRQRYEYFGFTPSGMAAYFSFNKDNAKHAVGSADYGVYSFENANGAENEKFAAELYGRRSAKVVRADDNFFTMLKTCRSTALIIKKSGKFFGYASVSGDYRTINEIEVENTAELPAVLADYLNRFELRGVAVAAIFNFEREKLKALDGVCENMSLHCCESFLIHDYVKITEAFLALKASYAKLYPCNVVIDIKGYCKMAIDITDKEFKVYATDKSADISLTPIEATRLLFGGGACFGLGDDIPMDLRANLPLPLFYSRPDFV